MADKIPRPAVGDKVRILREGPIGSKYSATVDVTLEDVATDFLPRSWKAYFRDAHGELRVKTDDYVFQYDDASTKRLIAELKKQGKLYLEAAEYWERSMDREVNHA